MAQRQIPMTDPRTFVVIHHSAASKGSGFGLDGFWAEWARRHEGYQIVLTQDEHLPHVNERPFADMHGVLIAQEAPDNEISNGTYGINPLSYNICLNGNFEEDEVTDAEESALVQVLAAKLKTWGWRKADALHRIITHQESGMKYSREYYVTACPGKNLIKKMGRVRSKVASYLPD